jgi:hypothetical protein
MNTHSILRGSSQRQYTERHGEETTPFLALHKMIQAPDESTHLQNKTIWTIWQLACTAYPTPFPLLTSPHHYPISSEDSHITTAYPPSPLSASPPELSCWAYPPTHHPPQPAYNLISQSAKLQTPNLHTVSTAPLRCPPSLPSSPFPRNLETHVGPTQQRQNGHPVFSHNFKPQLGLTNNYSYIMKELKRANKTY